MQLHRVLQIAQFLKEQTQDLSQALVMDKESLIANSGIKERITLSRRNKRSQSKRTSFSSST